MEEQKQEEAMRLEMVSADVFKKGYVSHEDAKKFLETRFSASRFRTLAMTSHPSVLDTLKEEYPIFSVRILLKSAANNAGNLAGDNA